MNGTHRCVPYYCSIQPQNYKTKRPLAVGGVRKRSLAFAADIDIEIDIDIDLEIDIDIEIVTEKDIDADIEKESDSVIFGKFTFFPKFSTFVQIGLKRQKSRDTITSNISSNT